MRPKYEWKNNEKILVGHVPTPLQQLRSMAQTRACSKVLSNLLKWVARMGGFAGTPAEEMTGNEFDADGNQAPPRQPQQRQAGNGGTGRISEKQASRIWALAHSANKSKDEVIALLKHFGFDTAKDVTSDKYEALCAELLKGDAQ
jgi:hypothetical protein